MPRNTVKVAAVLLTCLVLPAGISRCAADGGGPVLGLEIDFRVDEPVFFPGGPVPFALRLKLSPGASAAAVPADWYGSAAVGWAPAGADMQVSSVAALSTAAMADRQAGSTVTLTAEKRGDSAYLVLRPQDTAAMKPGAYVLRAAVDVPAVWGGGTSAPVRVTHSAPFTIVSPATAGQKSRLCLMLATYQVENENDLDGAIATVEKGLEETRDAELNHRLGWLYQSRGDLPGAVEAYERYIAWARASGGPRRHTGRGPQEIADELEKVVDVLRGRIAGPKPPAGP